MEEQVNGELVNSVGGITTSQTVVINVCVIWHTRNILPHLHYLIRVNRVSSQKRQRIKLDKTENKQRQRTKTNKFETRL
jgi:hypothetical protein